MKKTLLSLSLIAVALVGKAQNCSDLFISEYVEGSGNNKAVEIYNPTPNAINTNNNYRLIRYNNGTSAAAGEANGQAMVNLGAHTIQSGEAWVIVIDKRDGSQPCPGQECAVSAALQAKADTFLCPDYNVSYAMYFNGNDALSLQKYNGSTWNYVDIFARMGESAMTSGYGWSDAFPYDGSAGVIWTEDQTLFRKQSVKEGVKTNPNTFNVTVEWDSLPRDDYSKLGVHTCDCIQVGVKELNKSTVKLSAYPNPATTNDVMTIMASEAIKSIEVYNVVGARVITKEGNNFDKNVGFQTGDLSKGMYIVKVKCTDNKEASVKISIQ
ncbi:MAG: T9SS type A sorting domain-containing protein [Bacteroidota bacterium]